ncbi:ribonuclease Z [Aquabacterium sp. A7-Y]|uniref:ribonuclease Z n=1 Tax=Aquabacterium sp. A7-Y TaxID=1349605 RepID=UPI00223E447A|nr:ribonuclease Z [Aquabacterium sp. A7-Y]MCW7540139.1 ribonuclease Z [Aquabacterium sp. A7-Y]
MDLLFLGTSSGTPTKVRNVTGLALIEDTCRAWYLVDCGEATQHQLLHTRLSLNDLQAIFITHVHGDHCYGLPGLLASAGMSGRRKPLQIIAPTGIAGWMASTRELTRLHLPFELQFLATESLTGWKNNNWVVTAVPLSHRVPSFGYSFSEATLEPKLDTERLTLQGIPQGPLWGQLKKGMDVVHAGKLLKSSDYVCYPHKPRRIVVGGDNDRPELLTEACREAQVLVHESTYTSDTASKVGAGMGHSAAASVARFAQSVGLPHLLLTHFSARYGSDASQSPSIEDLRREAREHYQGSLFLAEDFARYRLDKTGQLSRVS